MESSRLILRRIRAAYLLVLLCASPGFAQSASPDPAQPLPLDPAVRSGRLANGLTYFVRRNVRPEKRVMLRLVVRAGSIDEADDQLGLAHVLEHMAFNGSTHFKSGELVAYLESIGARFGPHVNAYTSFDETVYMLDLPTDRTGPLTRGLEALADFAGGISLDEEEINRERGVVIEEWRGRQGASARMQQPQMDALYGHSRYLERQPIGTPESLKAFAAQRLRDFYREHYRADRMAVVAVGDIDEAVVEQQIREIFKGLPGDPSAARPVYPIPVHEETRFVSVTDREAQGTSVTLVHKRPLEPFRTVADYRRLLARALVNQMINARLGEIARQPEAPFIRAGVGDETLGRDTEAFSLSARVNEGGAERGLAALAQEVTRLRQHGFGAGELERAKAQALASYERAYNERTTTESSAYAGELVRHFVNNEPAPGIETELAMVRQQLREISLEETAALIRGMLPETNRVVLVASPERDGVAQPTEAGMREALRAGTAAAVTAWRDDIAGRELMPEKPRPGTVRGRRVIADLGVTVVQLSNGVDVWLKPTDFRNDQVLFTGYAKGGTSLAPPADYHNASLSTSLVGIAGVGGLSPTDIAKLLAGKIVNVNTYMAAYTHGIGGNATPRDLESALQLVHLHFVAPNKDPGAFLLMRRRLEAGLANAAENPGTVFGDRVRAVNTQGHYAARSIKLEDLSRLDPRRMESYYEARFANAADFTFFFTGAFEVDDILPLVTTYIGSLPSVGRATAAFADDRMVFPSSIVRETVHKGQEPRSQTVITFFADTGLDEFEAHRTRAAAQVLQMRLRDLLREELGGTYSVGVSYSDNSPMAGYGTTSVQFGSAPENAERLTKAVLTEVERLQRDGPSTADVSAVIEAERSELQTSFRQNGYWLNSLQAVHLLGRDPLRILQRIARAESLSTDNIHAALRKYFPLQRHTIVTLMPDATR